MNIGYDKWELFNMYNLFSWITLVGLIIVGVFVFKFLVRIKSMTIENRKLLQEIQARESLTSTAAHELKNPLTVIKGYAEIITRKHGNGTGRAIVAEADKINRLIDTLFNYTKLVHGQYKYLPQSFDLKTLIESKVKSFKIVYPDRKVLFITKLKSAPIMSDKVGIDQIITNLVTNAIRYTRKSVTIKLSSSVKTYTVKIEDEGEGISPQIQQVMWEAFTKPSTEGLGLGLFIVKQLIDSLGAKIEFTSGANGTIFIVTFKKGIKKHES